MIDDDLMVLLLKKKGTEAATLTLDAELKIARHIKQHGDVTKLMQDAIAWINEYEELALALPDMVKEQKADLLHYLQVARKFHEKNDPIQTIRWFPLIEENYEITLHNKRVIENKENGQKGGKVSKRREWADEVAARLKSKYPTLEKDVAWEQIPTSCDLWEVETNESEYKVYIDGDNLIAIDTATSKESSIKKSTFFKKYFTKRK